MRTAVLAVLTALVLSTPALAAPDLSHMRLTLGDEFNGSSLDTTKWLAGIEPSITVAQASDL